MRQMSRRQRDGSGVFSPDKVQGLKEWFDPNYGITTSTSHQYKAIQLINNTDYLTGSTAAFNPGTGDFTIGFSYYLDSALTGNHAFYEGGTIGAGTQFIWGYISSVSIGFYVGDGNAGYWNGTVSSTASKQLGVWQTLIVKFARAGNCTCKLNDIILTVTGAAMSHPLTVAPGIFNIGGFASGTTLPGRMDGFFYANRLTTDAEDTWLYNNGNWRQYSECGVAGTNGSSLTSAVIVGWFDFEQSGTNIGIDSTANANNLTKAGSPNQVNGINYSDSVATVWKGRSQSAYTLTNSTVINQPNIIQNGGNKALQFLGSQYLSGSIGGNLNQNYTLFLVGKKLSSNTSGGVFFDSSTGGNVQLSHNTSGRWIANAGTESYSQRSESSNYHIFSLVAMGSNSIIGVDGYEKITNAGTNSLVNIIIGQDKNNTNGLYGAISEVIVYNKALSYSDRSLIVNYLSSKYGISLGRLIIWYDGSGKIISRTPFDSLNDLTHIVDLNHTLTFRSGSPYYSKVVSFESDTPGGGKSIPAYTTDGVTTGGQYQEGMNDDIAPVNINATYITGDHGGAFGIVATVSSHDKTFVDVGSKWQDAALMPVTLLATLYNNDSTTLLFLRDNTSGTNPKSWGYYTSGLSGGTLTHVSGATNTSNIVYTAQSISQMIFPAHRNLDRSIKINGNLVPTNSGTYLCNYVDVRHLLECVDLNALVPYVQSKVGTSGLIPFDDPNISSIFKRDILYRVQPNAVTTVDELFTATSGIYSLNYMGMVQGEAPVIPTSGTLKLYSPKVSQFVINANTYNLSGIQLISGLSDALIINSSRWVDVNNPPERMMEITATSSGVNYSVKHIGYISEFAGSAGNLKLATNGSNYGPVNIISTVIKKMYPVIAGLASTTYPNPSTMNSGTTVHGNAFRSFKSYEDINAATDIVVAQSPYGSHYYVYFDYHANYSGIIKVPPHLSGRNIAVIDTHANVTLNSTVVSDTGISVVIANTYGYGVLKIQ